MPRNPESPSLVPSPATGSTIGPGRRPDATLADHAELYSRYLAATAHLDPPFALIDLAAFDINATALHNRAASSTLPQRPLGPGPHSGSRPRSRSGPSSASESSSASGSDSGSGSGSGSAQQTPLSAQAKPLRVATKSVRCRTLVARALATPGWRGVMPYTLAEAIWLVRTGITDNAVTAYPTADRASLATLAADPDLAATITLMVDDPAQLDLVDSVTAPARRAPLRICLELDSAWRPLRGGPGGRLHVGARRSPVHSASAAGRLAAQIAARRGFRLVGLMSYEAQIAGLGDAPVGQPARGALIRAMQRRSYLELLQRRGAAVEAVQAVVELEFVNGGGTGSVAATAADPVVTEVTAGSGLFGPTLFDSYRAWQPVPAAFFALSVVRRPTPDIATVLGGGWIASGPARPSRLPTPWLPAGLRLTGTEGAGEVQTPLSGTAAGRLRVGDRVFFRHAKAGELCEHVNEVHLIDGDRLVQTVPTYRGEGHAFL